MITMNQDLTDVIEYIQSIMKSMTRSTYLEVCVCDAHLYVIADRTVMYCIDLSGKLDQNILYGYHNLMDNFSAVIPDEYTINKVLAKYRELKGIELNNNKIFENDNLREDQRFEECIEAKATDGANFYFMNAINTGEKSYKMTEEESVFISRVLEDFKKNNKIIDICNCLFYLVAYYVIYILLNYSKDRNH